MTGTIRNINIILLFIFLTCSNIYGGENKLFAVNDFSKGLNTHTKEYLLPPGQCVIANNVRINEEYGSLSKAPVLQSYGSAGSHSITSLYRYYVNTDDTEYLIAAGSTKLYYGTDSTGTFTNLKTGLSDSERWTFVTFKNILIGMNGSDEPIKWDGATDTGTDDGDRTANYLTAELGAPFAECNTGTALDNDSWYSYKIAYLYDGTNYSYSNSVSNPIYLLNSNRGVTLTDIPIGESGTTERYIYRTTGKTYVGDYDNETYYLVATISDNSTTTYNDSMTDNDADNDAAPTWATATAGTAQNVTPENCKYCIIHEERMFTAGDSNYKSRMYFSDDANPDYFPITYFIDVRADDGDEITGIITSLGLLNVFKTNTISKYYTEGSVTTDWYASNVFSIIGCSAPYSIVNTPLGIFYLNRSGLYRFTGQYSQLVSDAITPEIRDIKKTSLNDVSGIYHNNEYRITYTSNQTGSSYNDKVLIYDTVRDAYVIDTRNIYSYCVFNSGDDEGSLYSGTSTTDGYIFTEKNDTDILRIRYLSELDLGTFDDSRSQGTENNPNIEIAWDCDIDGWLAELQTKDASINTINDIETYLPNAIIDRPDTDGNWISPTYKIDATALDQIKWNESLGDYGDITFQVNTGSTTPVSDTFSGTEYTDPTGSDISSETANTYIRLKINLSTTDIEFSPLLDLDNNYVFQVFYSKAGSANYESNIYTEWESGWLNFGTQYQEKQIKRIIVYYQATEGSLNFNYTNFEGDIDKTFTIDLSKNAGYKDTDGNRYFGVNNNRKAFIYYTPVGNNETPIGRYFKFNITDDGITEWIIDSIEVLYEVLPISDL